MVLPAPRPRGKVQRTGQRPVPPEKEQVTMKTKILGIDHIGIAVGNVEEALRFYTETLGLDAGPIQRAAGAEAERAAPAPCHGQGLRRLRRGVCFLSRIVPSSPVRYTRSESV